MLSYFYPISENGIIYSIDMIRFKFIANTYVLRQVCDYIESSCSYEHFESFKPCTYRDLFKIRCDNNSFIIGLCFLGFESKDNMSCFIEFNPNKVGSRAELKHILDLLRFAQIKLDLSNYDLAVDIPVDKSYVSLVKDRRVYKKFCYDSKNSNVTEYLGVNIDSGRVKLYNKHIESELDYSLTRAEITSRHLDYNLFMSQFPKIVLASNLGLIDSIKLSQTDKVLLELLQLSPDCMYYFKRLGRDKQKNLAPFLFKNDNIVGVSEKVFNKMKKIIDFFQKNVDIY